MMNFKTVCFILIICCYSCTNRSNRFVSEEEWKEKNEFIQGQIIGQLPIDLSREIVVLDSLMIISDAGSEPVYNVFKITGDEKIEYVSGFGTRGQGPNEFICNLSLKIKDEDTITIFDESLLRNYLIDKRSLLSESVYMVTKYLPNADSYNNLIQLKNNLYIGNGIFTEGMFAFYQNNSKIYLNIPYPDDGIPAANIQKGMVYQGCLAKQPGGNKIVYAGYYGRIFEIYELLDDISMVKIFSDLYEYPRYKPEESLNSVRANFTKDNRIGFFSISVTHEYIYALYCGKKSDEKNLDVANIIYVYDWNGQKIKKYVLDKEIVGISVNSQNDKVYGLYSDEKDDILKVICFNLSDVIHSKL
jgi:hypothetical protein